MEKILLALDTHQANINAVNFTSWLGALSGSKITGIVLENGNSADRLVHDGLRAIHQQRQKNNKTPEQIADIEKNIMFFKNTCEKNGNRFAIKRYTGDAAKDLIAQTRYADLLVMAAGTSSKKKFDGIPTTLVKDVLSGSECPVIIAPENFNGIDEIVFTCDGRKTSMFAIKQFCYLFPELNDKKISLLHVDEDGTQKKDEKELLKEWLSTHYSSIGFVTLLGDAEIELLSYLPEKKNIFLVMGAFGRTAISQYFTHSHAESLTETTSQAVFIAHC